jgi:hypothetical protein
MPLTASMPRFGHDVLHLREAPLDERQPSTSIGHQRLSARNGFRIPVDRNHAHVCRRQNARE